jgi:hypothetical protein
MGPSAAAAGTGTPKHAAKHRSNNKAFARQIPDLINPSLSRCDGARKKYPRKFKSFLV